MDQLDSLSDLLNDLYLSSSLNDGFVSSLKTLLPQTKDESLSAIVNGLLLQLSNRILLKNKIAIFNLLSSNLNVKNDEFDLKLFSETMKHISKINNIVPTSSIAKNILFFSKLCSKFQWKNLQIDAKKQLVQSLSILCGFFAKTKSTKFCDKNYKHLKSFLLKLDSNDLDNFHSVLNSESTATQNLNFCFLWDNVVRFEFETDNSQYFSQYKSVILDLIIKNVILSKVKIVDIVDSSSFLNILSQIDLNDLKLNLFPLLQKSILRNAEISLSLIVLFFDFLKFDPSDFSQDLGKILGTYLHSKDETLQEESINATVIFAKKCSTVDSIKFLLEHFVKIYNGSEGKITILSQKYSILKAIGALSINNIGDTSLKQAVFNFAIDELIKIVKQDTVEANIVTALTQVKVWIINSKGLDLADSFWKYIKELKKSKVATPLVMTSIYDCLFNVLLTSNDLNKQIASFDPELIGVIMNSAKNVTALITKIQILTESLYSSVLLLELLHFDNTLDAKFKNFLSSLNQFNKVTFISEKFINEASSDNLFYLIKFIELVIKTNLFLNDDNITLLYKSLVMLMCLPNSYEVRKKATDFYIEHSKNNPEFVGKLIIAFYDLYNDDSLPSSHVDHVESVHKLKCCQIIINSVNAKYEETNFNLFLEAFKICHFPTIYNQNQNMCLNFLKKRFIGEELDLFFEKNYILIINFVISSVIPESIKLNVVKTLTKLKPHKFVEGLVHEVSNILDQHITEFKSISQDDYEIYLTPQGNLYNKSVVKSAGEVVTEKNMKRESKLYSYKEQIAELEFRKELQSKQKDVDDIDLSKLTKKQREVYSQQLAKEDQTRNYIELLNQKFVFSINILQSMIETNKLVTSIYFKDIIFTLVNLFTSILCHEKVTNFFLKIGHSLMIYDPTACPIEYVKFVDTLSFTIVRLYESNNAPNEELSTLIVRLVDFLYARTCPNSGINYDETLDRLANANRLSTPAFSFVFPLLRYVLLNLNANIIDSYDETVVKCLECITQHSLIRTDTLNSLEYLKNPQNLPIKQVLETLVKFMEKNLLNHEKLASSTLISVVSCMNGDPGCGKATTGDLFVLLNSLTHQNDLIRFTCFEALSILAPSILPNIYDDHCKAKLVHRVFIGMFDTQTECQVYAKNIFESCHFETNEKMLENILDDDVENINSVLMVPVSQSYKYLLKEYPQALEAIYEKLTKFYSDKAIASIPSVDAFGRQLSKDHVDNYEPRLTIAYIFKNIVPYFNQAQVKLFIKFLIPEALSDNSEYVRSAMLESGCQLIDSHGKDNVNYFLDVFETFLDNASDDHKNDLVRKSVIIFMGTLAKHIDSDNPKLKPILSRLVEALSTPSQIVQEAVANCLQYLIPKFKDDAPALLQKLLQFLFESEIYGERKGAAYGIAGIVKGLGILSLNKLGIMDALTQAIQAKDKPNNREGALFAFEMLSSMLGRLFEPYIVHILPFLLDCFGDSSVRVRQAADDTAKIIMSKLSAPGVTLIYPAILTALEDDSWRKKTSSIELLGSMAFCAPKQLSQCLPMIVPKLMTVIIDSHPKVQKSAAQALKQIGSVIKNPEIQNIVPTLLEALQDPAIKTNKCLNVMLCMKFVHVIDPPSLALIMPVIERAFQNRSTETRKMASQIIGNMYALTKSKDLSPYLPSIMPGLKNSLLDPVPEVRGVTARALGTMVKGLGDEILSDLLPWLKGMLISELSSVDRSGAAQGLSEVLGGLGANSLDTFMPEIIEITERSDVPPHVKDGYIMLFIYLPLVFTKHFADYISQVINPILQALADENEFVRETALRAGQRIVNMYAETAIQLLLPELEKGLFDENWRIRYSSVQLLGDLLFKIIGVTGKMTTESGHEDDNFGTEQSHKAIFEAMGEERRNYVLSGLYMGRSDVSLHVRQASLHVWKVIVTNTPRTLKEILPVLFSLLLSSLASNSSDRQQIAAKTLGDLVRKLGERILPEIIPILEQGLQSDRPDQRQGVCIGLSEIIASTSREMIQAFADSLIPTVRKALFDSLPEVRQAAARTFDHLYSAIGNKALDDIISKLLNNLDDPVTGERTLDSLKHIISFKSKVVLPYLIPKLIVEPVNTRALSFISSVAGDSLSKHLPKIMPALLSALSSSFDTPNYQEQLEYCQTVIVSITDEHGARSVVISLLDYTNSEDLNMRRVATSLLVTYCVQSRPLIIANFRSQLLRGLILMLSSNDEFILNQCVDALNAITKNLNSNEQIEIVPEVRKALRHTISDYKSSLVQNGTSYGNDCITLPGFRTNKAILPIINLFKEALLSSNIDSKEHGANGYRDIVQNSSSEALKPTIMGIAGPLLRIIADRIPSDIKVIIIDILSILLFKVGNLLKPFYPQIQVIFFRSLNDSDRNVRLQAAVCISRFSTVHTRLDAFFNELINIVKNSPYDQTNMKETGFYAIRLAISMVGSKVSESIHKQIIETVIVELDSLVDCTRKSAAACLGALCASLADADLEQICNEYLLDDSIGYDWVVRHYRSTGLRIALKVAFDRIVTQQPQWANRINTAIKSYIYSPDCRIAISGIKCAAYYISNCLDRNIEPSSVVLAAFAKGMNNSNNEVKQNVATATIFWSHNRKDIPTIILRSMVPLLVNGTKEKNTIVRVNSEHALISLLKLKHPGEQIFEKCLKCLDTGAVESLQDCVVKIKKTIAKSELKEEEFDDTLLSVVN